MLSIFSIYNTCLNVKFKSNVLIIPIFILFVLLLIRERGWDLELYKEMFVRIEDLNIEEWVEPGFQIAILSVKSIDGDFYLFNFLYSIFICVLMYLIGTYRLKYPFIFILLLFLIYFFRGPYGQMRQAISMFIFLFSLRYINHKEIYFFILNLIGISIHSVSILPLLSFFIIKYINIDKKQLFFIVVMCFIFIGFDLSAIILNSSFFDFQFFKKIQYYTMNTYGLNGFITPVTCRIIFVSCVICFVFPNLSVLSKYEKIMITTFILGVVTYALFSYDLRIASRSSRIFIIIELLILTKAMEYSKNKSMLFSVYFVYGIIYLVWELFIMKKGEVIYVWG